MRRTMMALAGVVGAAAVAMPVWARSHGRPPGPPPCGDGAMRAVMAMLHGGDLSDDQHDQARARLDADRSSVEATMDALRDANEQLTAQLLASDAPDATALQATLDRIATLRAALLDQQVQTALALRGLLSADQLAAAAADTPPDHGFAPPPAP